MVRQDPIANAFVSVKEPKPPLHIWLLALFLHAVSDPLRAGRLLSVAAGAATVLAVFPLGRLLTRLGDPASAQRDRKGAGYGAASAMLVATCPYLAFYDRLALADGLVVLAGVIVAWLSLRLARTASEPPGPQSPAKVGLVLGLALGLAMLTRQSFSYVLWLLPPLAFLVWPRRSPLRNALRRYFSAQLIALGVALTLWAPYLFARSDFDVWTRILYHERFLRRGTGAAERARTAVVNAVTIFSPFQPQPDGRWRFGFDVGWFWTYLTPPVAILCVFGLVWLVLRNERRLAAFLAGWFLLTCAPLVLFATVLFPRYGVAAVVPLLLAGGRVAWLGIRRLREALGLRATALLACVVAVLLSWPIGAVVRQSADWRHQPLVAADRGQYIWGWPAGSAVRDAIQYIRSLSTHTPILVINVITEIAPNVGVTVAFEDDPRVRVFHADSADLIASVESWTRGGPLYLRRDVLYSDPVSPTTPPAGARVLCVWPEPMIIEGKRITARSVAGWGTLVHRVTFRNPRVPRANAEPAAISVAEMPESPRRSLYW